MALCSNCGSELHPGRFCTRCGHPIGAADAPDLAGRTDTAERPAIRVPPPPSTPPPPPIPPPPTTPPPAPAGATTTAGPRFPLFADEVLDLSEPPPAAPGPSPQPTHHRRQRPWGMWVAIVAVLGLVAGLGAWLLTGDDDSGGAAANTSRTDRRTTPGPTHSPSPSEKSSPPASPSAENRDITSRATVRVPATAPPNEDTTGHRVTYVGANMLDRIPETCWRMVGDGTGKDIKIALPGKTTLRRVGLINGYAKSAREGRKELDWYHGNRRIEAVEWIFDDGTSVEQDLRDTAAVQSVDVDGVTTSTITLRLVSVSAPGKGPAARNNTAISDLSIVGDPQGN